MKKRRVVYGPLEGAIVNVIGENEDGVVCVVVKDHKPYKIGDEVMLEKYELSKEVNDPQGGSQP